MLLLQGVVCFRSVSCVVCMSCLVCCFVSVCMCVVCIYMCVMCVYIYIHIYMLWCLGNLDASEALSLYKVVQSTHIHTYIYTKDANGLPSFLVAVVAACLCTCVYVFVCSLLRRERITGMGGL